MEAYGVSAGTTNIAPTVSLTSPANSYTAPANITLNATAADSDGTIAKVEFFNGATLLGTDTAAPYSFTYSNAVAGSYSFTAKATDNQGASTTSSPVAITVNAAPAANGIYYIYADHLNTPRVITNTANTTVWKWDSDPFGTDVPNQNPAGVGTFSYNLRFPGQYYDKETGLHYNYYRDGYDPSTGRYTQSDPIGLSGGLNTYVYVFGNPLSSVDPEGLETQPRSKPEAKWLSCGDCARKIAELAEQKKRCDAELASCKTDADEIRFIEKYNGSGFDSALFNCKTEGDPTFGVRLTWGCWCCTQQLRMTK